MSNWANEVDKYIEENEILRNDPEAGGMAGLYRILFALATFGIWPLLKKLVFNRFRTLYFHQYIHNRKGEHKVEDQQKMVDHVLEQEATRLKEDEEVLFVITDGSNFAIMHAMVFTNDRLIYALEGPERTTVKDVSGEIKLTDLGKPTVKRTMADSCIVGFGDEKIGALTNFKNDEMLLDFLRQIKLALNN